MTGQGPNPYSPSSYVLFFCSFCLFNGLMSVVIAGLHGPVGWVLGGASAFGVAVLLWTLLRLNEVRLAVTQSSVEGADRRAVRRAVLVGPVPAEPGSRAVALEVAAAELAFANRYRWLSLGLLALVGTFAVYWAVTQTPVAWIVAAVIGTATAYDLAWRAVLRRRVELLSVAGCERRHV